MPRQTNEKSIQIPDGFQFAIDSGKGFEDVGILAGGATATLSWDEFYMDAGNYEALIDRAKNLSMAVAPSALWNFNPQVIAKLFPGVLKATSALSPSAGTNIDYSGTGMVDLTRVTVRMTHFPNALLEPALIADDIIAISNGTNNQLVTIPLSTFLDILPHSVKIDGYIHIDGMTEVAYADRDEEENQGNFCTDATNLYLIVDLGTYADLAAAKAALVGEIVGYYDEIDWQFTFYNCKVDSGGSFNFKGVNEDGLDEITVSFTGKPDPKEAYRLFKFFKAS